MIEFIPVTKENYAQALQLAVMPEQEGMIETVEECVREAEEIALWRPVLLVEDGVTVGFAMYGAWDYPDGSERVWLDRFLIDAHHQGRGCATRVLPALMAHIGKIYGCETLYLSVYETNSAAIRLYERFGFAMNGALDINGEKVMEATLQNAPKGV